MYNELISLNGINKDKVNWKDIISLKHSADEIWDLDSNQINKDWGKLLHKVLADIHYMSDKDEVIESFFRKGKCTNEEFERLRLDISNLLSDSSINKFFNNDWEVKNEKSILLENGELYIPDRILFHKTLDKIVIIDYKTGVKKNEHIKQITKYANALHKMGYQNIEKFLIYTSSKEKLLPV